MLPGSGGEKGSCCSPFFDLLGDNRLGGRAEGGREKGRTDGGRAVCTPLALNCYCMPIAVT